MLLNIGADCNQPSSGTTEIVFSFAIVAQTHVPVFTCVALLEMRVLTRCLCINFADPCEHIAAPVSKFHMWGHMKRSLARRCT